jgi:hypothetical protein
VPTIETLGGPSKRRTFSYEGSASTGVVLLHDTPVQIDVQLFDAVRLAFSGRTIPLGTGRTSPTPGGLGEWLVHNSRAVNRRALTSGHASFVAAILVHEGHARTHRIGNAVHLQFG